MVLQQDHAKFYIAYRDAHLHISGPVISNQSVTAFQLHCNCCMWSHYEKPIQIY